MECLDNICKEPYRLFFPLGILMGVWGVSHWVWYAVGLSKSYSGFFHSSLQILVYMNCFIVGFLSTAIPRFTASSHATKFEVGSFFFLLLAISFFLIEQKWVIAQVLYIVFLGMLIRFVLLRLKHRVRTAAPGKAPKELIWVPMGLLHGIVGTVLLILGETGLLPAWSIKVGKPMMDQGFLLCVVIGIGGFLIPRLMGTYQSDDHEAACTTESKLGLAVKNRSIMAHFLCAVILFASFWLEGLEFSALAYGLRAAVITYQFAGAGVLKFLLQPCDFYVRLAWISVWLTAVGYWGAALFIDYQKMMLHITFIGGFSLMTFAIATMVVFSHAGEAQRLKRPLGILWVVAIGLTISFLERAMVAFFPDKYFHVLGGAATFWLIAAVSWLIFIFPSLLKVPQEDEFAKMHQQVEQHVSLRIKRS